MAHSPVFWVDYRVNQDIPKSFFSKSKIGQYSSLSFALSTGLSTFITSGEVDVDLRHGTGILPPAMSRSSISERPLDMPSARSRSVSRACRIAWGWMGFVMRRCLERRLRRRRCIPRGDRTQGCLGRGEKRVRKGRRYGGVEEKITPCSRGRRDEFRKRFAFDKR